METKYHQAGLWDRSSRNTDAIEAQVVLLRKEWRAFDGIADETGISPASAERILKHHGIKLLFPAAD